jgi:hypothetical protein
VFHITLGASPNSLCQKGMGFLFVCVFSHLCMGLTLFFGSAAVMAIVFLH